MLKSFSRIRFSGKADGEKDSSETNGSNEKDSNASSSSSSPSLIPRRSPRPSTSTEANPSPSARLTAKLTLEISKIDVFHENGSLSLESIHCIVRLGRERKLAFQSSIATKSTRGHFTCFGFPPQEAVLRDISTTEFSSRYVFVTVYNQNAESLGEASLSLVSNATNSSKPQRIVLLKDRKRIGEVFFTLTRPEEGFFEDSASEDGEQASATPSPAVAKPSLMAVNASPAAPLDFSDVSSASVREHLMSPKSPLRARQVLGGNTTTLLTLSNISVHNASLKGKADAGDTRASEVLAASTLEAADASATSAPVFEPLTSNDELITMIDSTTVKSIEDSPTAMEQPASLGSSPIDAGSVATVVEAAVPPESPPAVVSSTKDSTPVASEIIGSIVDAASLAKELAPAVVVAAAETPSANVTSPSASHQHDTQDNSPVASSSTVPTVAATPSMTVIGSHSRPRRSAAERQQLRHFLLQSRGEPVVLNVETPQPAATSITRRKEAPLSTGRRSLADVRARLTQSLENLDQTMTPSRTVDRTPRSPSDTASPVATPEVSSSSSSSELSNHRFAKRLLTSATVVEGETPVSATFSTLEQTASTIESSESTRHLSDSLDIESSPAVCLLADFDEDDKESVAIATKETAVHASTVLVPTATTEEPPEDTRPPQLSLAVCPQKQTSGPSLSPWTVLGSVVVVLMVLVSIYVASVTTQVGIYGVVSPMATTTVRDDVRLTQEKSLPSQVSSLLPSLPPPVQMQLYASAPSSGSSRFNADAVDAAPRCLTWMSYPTAPAIDASAVTKPAPTMRPIWSRVTQWWRRFALNVRRRLRLPLTSMGRLLPPTTVDESVAAPPKMPVMPVVEGILRAGDCQAAAVSASGTWWRMYPVPSLSAGVDAQRGEFFLQFLGDVVSASRPKVASGWCLSLGADERSTVLRPCLSSSALGGSAAGQSPTRWRLEYSHLTATSELVDRDSGVLHESMSTMRWQYNAHYRTQAIAFKAASSSIDVDDEQSVSIAMVAAAS